MLYKEGKIISCVYFILGIQMVVGLRHWTGIQGLCVQLPILHWVYFTEVILWASDPKWQFREQNPPCLPLFVSLVYLNWMFFKTETLSQSALGLAQ